MGRPKLSNVHSACYTSMSLAQRMWKLQIILGFLTLYHQNSCEQFRNFPQWFQTAFFDLMALMAFILDLKHLRPGVGRGWGGSHSFHGILDPLDPLSLSYLYIFVIVQSIFICPSMNQWINDEINDWRLIRSIHPLDRVVVVVVHQVVQWSKLSCPSVRCPLVHWVHWVHWSIHPVGNWFTD